MSQTLTLELSDPVFTVIRQQAERMGIPPDRHRMIAQGSMKEKS